MLNDAQKAALKAAIAAETDPVFVQYRTDGSPIRADVDRLKWHIGTRCG